MAVPVTCIMSKPGWSQECTFAKFYDKLIATEIVNLQIGPQTQVLSSTMPSDLPINSALT
ncbi:hypothetical protein E2C01_045172 [Portunus trituberculatus]|uniref:Uncharacterized protein n=1 Tax=Portunus trituberculatus TaxID=210409 RepID=A0A5B7G2F8_PORTR|nr:hypothetical protein [Portunus trituberculatus]